MNHRLRFAALLALLTGCQSQIQHGLDERDANEIVSVLVGRGFDARKVSEKGKKPTWAIEVDDEHATDAVRVLSELKLPRPPRTTTRDLTSQASLIETPAAEKLRQYEALEGDIEQTLETMDGVTSAGVELVVPPTPRPGQPVTPSKASALLRVTPDNLERLQQQREHLKALIASSVEGLKADDVSLLIDPVETRVAAVAPTVDPLPSMRLKVMVFSMAVMMIGLGVALVALTLRLRELKAQLRPRPATPAPREAPPARPVIAPGAQKRVA